MSKFSTGLQYVSMGLKPWVQSPFEMHNCLDATSFAAP